MSKRQLILGTYKTAEDGLWTLASCKIKKASQVQNFVSVPGRFAPLNLSTALTDGEPYYGNATLEAVLESSEGTRDERQGVIAGLTQILDGREIRIVHPDWPDHYLIGTVQVTKEYNDPAHARVKLTAICEPWFYGVQEFEEQFLLSDEPEQIMLFNTGQLGVHPKVGVEDELNISTLDGTKSVTLSAGTHYIPWLYLPGLRNTDALKRFNISGSGTVTFTYREAVLAH